MIPTARPQASSSAPAPCDVRPRPPLASCRGPFRLQNSHPLLATLPRIVPCIPRCAISFHPIRILTVCISRVVLLATGCVLLYFRSHADEHTPTRARRQWDPASPDGLALASKQARVHGHSTQTFFSSRGDVVVGRKGRGRGHSMEGKGERA